MAGFATLFFFDKVLPEGMREQKVMSFFGIFMGGSMVSSAITKTDAFEIYLGRKLVFSTLKMHRKPTMEDLTRSFGAHGITFG